jgi:hypothetical protein
MIEKRTRLREKYREHESDKKEKREDGRKLKEKRVRIEREGDMV